MDAGQSTTDSSGESWRSSEQLRKRWIGIVSLRDALPFSRLFSS